MFMMTTLKVLSKKKSFLQNSLFKSQGNMQYILQKFLENNEIINILVFMGLKFTDLKKYNI